jgi:hypothetical protein
MPGRSDAGGYGRAAGPAPAAKKSFASVQSVLGVSARVEEVLAGIGRPDPQHILYAASLLDELPPLLRENARDPVGAAAIVFALLIDKQDPEVRQKQFAYLFGHANQHIYSQTRKLLDAVAGLDRRMGLPLIDLAVPALAVMSQPQYAMFRENVSALADADGYVDLFEFVLKAVVFHHLDSAFAKGRLSGVRYRSLNALWEDCTELLSLLAYVGCPVLEEAEEVFRAAVSSLDPSRPAKMTHPDRFHFKKMEKSLEKLAGASSELKEKFIRASILAVQHNGKIDFSEIEIIRAFSDALDCPLPPLLETVTEPTGDRQSSVAAEGGDL